MSRELTLFDLQHSRGDYVCCDEAYNYYNVWIDGRCLMYRRRSLRPDSRKAYMITDELARLLGFEDAYYMAFQLPHIQYWRKFISVERLKIALERFKYWVD